MDINFKHPTCKDGWIIVNKNQLAGPYAANWHIVEVELNPNDSVKSRAVVTFCGEHLNDKINWDRQHHIFRNDFEGRAKLRNEIARLQNVNEEFCGKCAAHLYLG